MKKIPLTNSSEFVLVDDCQYKKAMKLRWHKTKGGYARSTTHPQILLYVYLFGKASKGFEWDHRNRNPLDNQRHNLRAVTKAKNVQNSGLQKNNRTGFKGVHLTTSHGHPWFRATVRCNKKLTHIGYFKDPIRAAKAYDEMATKLHGEFAVLNFPMRFPRLRAS